MMTTITAKGTGGFTVEVAGDGWTLSPQWFPTKTAAQSFADSIGFGTFVAGNADAFHSYEFTPEQRDLNRMMRENSSAIR